MRTVAVPMLISIEEGSVGRYGRNWRRYVGRGLDEDRREVGRPSGPLAREQGHGFGAELLAPAEQLLRVDVVLAGDRRNVDARNKGFRRQRDLALVRPVPPPLRPRNHLDAARPPRRSVITTVKHRVKSIAPPTRDDDRSDRAPEGGGGAALTTNPIRDQLKFRSPEDDAGQFLQRCHRAAPGHGECAQLARGEFVAMQACRCDTPSVKSEKRIHRGGGPARKATTIT